MAKYKVEFEVVSEEENAARELDYYLNKYIEHALPAKGRYEAGYVYVDKITTE